MIKKIVFEVETITPMFLSGADQGKAELRAASIKGLLRYWWRALQAEDDLNKLRDRENGIFGSADEGYGASSFSIRISHDGELKSTKDKFPQTSFYKVPVEGKTFKINILEYLAYGTYEYKRGEGNVFIREYIPSGCKFIVSANIFRKDYLNDILTTIYIFSLFGGIGSRSRNGFGSFNILNKVEVFEDIKASFSIDQPYEKKNLEKTIKKGMTSYSAFSKMTKVFRAAESYKTAFESLASIGKVYKNTRVSLEKRHFFDKRQYIGAPIVEKKKTHSFLDRRAKPYFIKVAKEGEQYRSYILYLPALYCEGLEKDNLNKPINHSEANKKFKEVCNEFNEFLSQNMETIL